MSLWVFYLHSSRDCKTVYIQLLEQMMDCFTVQINTTPIWILTYLGAPKKPTNLTLWGLSSINLQKQLQWSHKSSFKLIQCWGAIIQTTGLVWAMKTAISCFIGCWKAVLMSPQCQSFSKFGSYSKYISTSSTFIDRNFTVIFWYVVVYAFTHVCVTKISPAWSIKIQPLEFFFKSWSELWLSWWSGMIC